MTPHVYLPPYGDNYQYLITHQSKTLVVDPFDAPTTMRTCASLELDIVGVIHTHTHWDHLNGTQELARETGAPIYVHPNGVGDLQGIQGLETIDEGDQIELDNQVVRCWYTPGHHPAHLTFEAGNVLYVGDVLFWGGCGNPNLGGDVDRLFDTIERFFVDHFSDDLVLAFGHDYAEANLAFAQQYDPNLSVDLPDDVLARTLQPLSEARKTSPFLRYREPVFVERVEQAIGHSPTPRETFKWLRAQRDQF